VSRRLASLLQVRLLLVAVACLLPAVPAAAAAGPVASELMVALPGSTADADDSRAACTTPVVNSRTVALGVEHELTGDPRSSTPSLALRLAAKVGTSVTRSLDDLGSLRGAEFDEVRRLVPEHWIEKPLKKGEGTRFLNPDRPGEAIMLEKGWPGAADPLHSGPYARISRHGKIERIPLAGNPTLK
jgi:hypothetical protein